MKNVTRLQEAVAFYCLDSVRRLSKDYDWAQVASALNL